MISIVIFSLVILGLAGLTFQVARYAVRSTDQALLTGAIVSRVDEALVVPFDSLTGTADCDTTVAGGTWIIGCTAVETVTSSLKRITVVVRTTLPGARADTIVFERSRVRDVLPLR
jgi:Tfp pilus assembly protein PilV